MIARKINERQPEEISKFIVKQIKRKRTKVNRLNISILGLAFKGYPITDDLRGSMAIAVVKNLKKKLINCKFYGFDPIISSNKIKSIGLKPLHKISDAFKKKILWS